MKILSYKREGSERAGLLIDQTIYDIQVCSTYFNMPPIPSDLFEIIRLGLLDRLRQLEERLRNQLKRSELPLACKTDVSEAVLAPPIRTPSKIVCLGRNYREHAIEQGAKVPEMPLLFAKAPSAIIGPSEPIVIPRGSTRVDFEGELAFVIGKPVSRANQTQAQQAILGYCCINDVTEREMQFSDKQWFRSKSVDTFAPLGPWIVTAEEIPYPPSLGITTTLNSKVMQSDSTANLIFKPAEIVEFISRHITLVPGDVIATGTPAGVGVFRDPQIFLKHGDVVEITIDMIGTLSNRVVAEENQGR